MVDAVPIGVSLVPIALKVQCGAEVVWWVLHLAG